MGTPRCLQTSNGSQFDIASPDAVTVGVCQSLPVACRRYSRPRTAGSKSPQRRHAHAGDAGAVRGGCTGFDAVLQKGDWDARGSPVRRIGGGYVLVHTVVNDSLIALAIASELMDAPEADDGRTFEQRMVAG